MSNYILNEISNTPAKFIYKFPPKNHWINFLYTRMDNSIPPNGLKHSSNWNLKFKQFLANLPWHNCIEVSAMNIVLTFMLTF